MDTILPIILVVLLIGLIIFSFINPKMEKYRKYVLILIPFIVFLLLYIFKRKEKKNTESQIDATEFKAKLEEVKGDLKEVTTIAEIKRKCSEEKKEEDLKELEEVTKMPDKVKRRKRLAATIG